MQYQIQEMIRLERMYEPELIQEELDVYNPRIPERQSKGDAMIEYSDAEERKEALANLIGFEHAVWVQVGEMPPVHPIANEKI